MNMIENKKIAFFLPNLFTALNLGCGYFSILQTIRGNYKEAAVLIAVGILFDLLDGRMARLMGAQSLFGEQFDSLSDLVTFAVAPSILYYHFFLADLGRIGLVTSFFYCLCGALRLARFNANVSKVDSNYFQGLPSPAAACGVLGFVLFWREFYYETMMPSVFSTIYITFYAFLMITTIPFPSFKKSEWVARNKNKSFFIILILILMIVLNEESMILAVISLYVVGALIYSFFHRKISAESIIDEAEE